MNTPTTVKKKSSNSYSKFFNTMSITMVSRVLGLIRGQLIARYFGASMLSDAYFSAFKISNFFRQLLGEGALGNTFIPLYNEKSKVDGEEKSKEYIFTVLNAVFLFSVFISIIMCIFSTPIISIIAPGFDLSTKLLASELLRIMSFYFIFISLAGMMGSILNNFGHFAIPASTSIFFNLAIIFAALLFSKTYGIHALAYGVVFGGFLQFCIVLFPLLKILKRYSFKINFKDVYLKVLMIKLLPMLIGVFGRQINSMVDQFFASFLVVGGVSNLEFASRIYLLPVGIFGVSIANILFPSISKLTVEKDNNGIEKEIIKGINMLSFFVIPCVFVLTFYSRDIVKLMFGYGKFSETALDITSSALLYYSLGLYFYASIHLVSKSFYAMGDNKRPAKYSLIAILVNIILNIILIDKLAYKGLALATSISALVNFMLLTINFRKLYLKVSLKSILIMITRVALFSSLALLISYNLSNTFLKLIVFSVIYLVLWSYQFYKKRKDIFS